jgi:hypothetical protein
MDELSRLLLSYRPFIVFCFGAFSFEFVNRANGGASSKYGRWGAADLGKVFSKRIQKCDNQTSNILPLLHRSISGGNFLKSHEYFVGSELGNYFEYVGEKIANVLLANKDEHNIWIKHYS